MLWVLIVYKHLINNEDDDGTMSVELGYLLFGFFWCCFLGINTNNGGEGET